MADHNKPTTASAYASFVTEVDGRFDDLTLGLDPAYTAPTNLPTNALRFSSAAAKWQRWTGSAWTDAAAAYAINITGGAAYVTNGVYTTGSYADPGWLTSVAGSKITGNISGNAGTATTLATARTINGVSFNGSANISVNTNSSVTFNNAGSGAASGVTFNGGSAITVSYNTVGAPSTTGTNASGTWGISISGNAATATSAGNASTVTNGVYTTGNQTIGGVKTFSSTVNGVASGSTTTSAFYAATNGGTFSAMWTRYAPYRAAVSHTGSSYAPGFSMYYEYTGEYSGHYSIGHLTTGGANPGNFAIHHINSAGAASNTWLFDGVNGDFTASGNVTAYSDERLKTNWQDLPSDFLERLARIKSGTYDRKDTGETQAGVSAQDMRDLLGPTVREGASGFLSLAYGNAALVSCVALARELLSLKAEIASLKG